MNYTILQNNNAKYHDKSSLKQSRLKPFPAFIPSNPKLK